MRQTAIAATIATLALAPAAAAQPAGEPPEDEDVPATAPADAPDDEGAEAAPEPAAEALDVDALRRRYLELRDELFRSRARAAAVASSLYSTRIAIGLDYGSPRHHTVTRATIRLDGASVYDDTRGQIVDDQAVRFEGYVAPGRHRVTVRIEAAAKDDGRFTTATESTFVVIAPRGKDLVVKARAADDGNLGYRWQKKSSGTYRLRLDVDVEAREPEKGTGNKGMIKRASQ